MTKKDPAQPLSRRRKILKHVRNVTISIVALTVLTVGAGVGYTWYMGQQPAVEAAVIEDETGTLRPAVSKPRTVASDAKVSVSTQMITSPVEPGENASITARTNPEARCTIAVTYGEIGEKENKSDDSGLVDKVADEYGVVSWTWSVEATRPTGKWPVEVTCENDKHSAYLRAELVVKALN